MKTEEWWTLQVPPHGLCMILFHWNLQWKNLKNWNGLCICVSSSLQLSIATRIIICSSIEVNEVVLFTSWGMEHLLLNEDLTLCLNWKEIENWKAIGSDTSSATAEDLCIMYALLFYEADPTKCFSTKQGLYACLALNLLCPLAFYKIWTSVDPRINRRIDPFFYWKCKIHVKNKIKQVMAADRKAKPQAV